MNRGKNPLAKVNCAHTAEQIVKHWERLGYKVNAWVEESNGHEVVKGKTRMVSFFQVRSDLVDGMPKGAVFQ